MTFSNGQSDGPSRRVAVAAGLLLLAATVAAYVPALSAGYIWDDDDHITDNPVLRDAAGLRRIWIDLRALPQFYPLTHTTFWIEYQLWGDQPFGYHLVNILLHALNAVLVWRVLRRLGLVPGAWLAAALFALHPVHVESAAWITERKNVLSTFFYLMSMLAYLRLRPLEPEISAHSPTESARRESRPPGGLFYALAAALIRQSIPESRTPGWLFYALSLAAFMAAMLSKTVACSLPAAILLLTWWKRGRLRWRDVTPLLPFFVVGVVLGLVTVWMERHHVGALGVEWSLTFLERVLIAGRAVWFYLGKLVWPTNLSFIYPRWDIDAGDWTQHLYPLALLAALAGLLLARRRIGRGPLTAALFFIGTLFPALGFFDVYPMRYAFVADHFQYLASVGMFALASAVFVRVVRPWLLRALAVCVVLALLAGATWSRCGAFRDEETLWRDTLATNPSAWMASNNLALILQGRGEIDEAADLYRRALELYPDYPEAHTNYGSLLARQGRIESALDHLRRSIALNPNNDVAHNNLGNVLADLGRRVEAIRHYEQAVALRPSNVNARFNLAMELAALGRLDDAISHLTEVVRLAPDDVEARERLAELHERRGSLSPFE
jgi:tetratricopeptide (TPR) repeat protein